MPVCSGLSHWYKSEQRNHWFGYWFGHDMFTPPFTDPKTGKLSYDNDLRAELLKDPTNAKLIYPEMDAQHDSLWRHRSRPFLPDLHRFSAKASSRTAASRSRTRNSTAATVYLITQNALADGTYLDYLRAQYNRSKQIDPPFFSELFQICFRPVAVGSGRARTAALTALDQQARFTTRSTCRSPKWGAYVEKYRRARGVYPPNEIYIPSPDDSQKCFEDYTEDVGRRAAAQPARPRRGCPH